MAERYSLQNQRRSEHYSPVRPHKSQVAVRVSGWHELQQLRGRRVAGSDESSLSSVRNRCRSWITHVAKPSPLIARKEEGLVMDDRTTDGAAELVAFELV